MSKLPQIVIIIIVHGLADREACETSVLGQHAWHLSWADRK
jgi:hypothetical protein